ncbi:MAG TPA: class I SAM-dependent methyltransferase [Dehalococcoidales bacterium]|nr:class I SAM-dependent methyltransferase [Dehalococcoidales bacterium]
MNSRPGPAGLTVEEQLTALVYGDTFSMYDEKAYDAFIEPFRTRLKTNAIPLDIFKGKRCLDAGCGGGRGSILMAENGASEVIAFDLSEKNIATTRRWARRKGLNSIKVRQGSLMELPFADEEFDIIWCNGVLHHSNEPDRGLQEITRVLKTGGNLWLYLYGSGGIYWHVIDWIRGTLSGVAVAEAILLLHLAQLPVGRIAERIDDWFVPHLRRYTAADVTNRLRELGYDNTDTLKYGTDYDTSQRRVGAGETEKSIMGEGDLRFFCRKAGGPAGHRFSLPDPPDGKGSPYRDGKEVLKVDVPLARLTAALDRIKAAGDYETRALLVLACSSVHQKARSLLETKEKYDMPSLLRHLADLADVLEKAAGYQKKADR